MKIRVNRKEFATALELLGKVASTSSSLKVLGSVFLGTDEHGAFARSTDLETHAVVRLPSASVDVPGAACAELKTLVKLVKADDGADVCIHAETANTVRVEGARLKPRAISLTCLRVTSFSRATRMRRSQKH